MSDEIMGNYFPLIQSTMEHFEIQEDIDTCDRTEQTFQRIQDKRKLLIDQSLDSLRNLNRKVELSRAKIDSLLNSNTQKASQQIAQLDRDKFSIAKSLNELEQSNTTNQTTLDILKQQYDELKDINIVDETTNQYIDNSTILRLKFFRSLGIKFNKLEDGEVDGGEKEKDDKDLKVLIQSSENRMHVFPIDKDYSRQFISNYIWEHM